MAIPRLPPAAEPISVTFTIGVNLRPYFTEWYQQTKREGDTPASFALRELKEAARKYYLQREVPIALAQLESDKTVAAEALGADIESLDSELDG